MKHLGMQILAIAALMIIALVAVSSLIIGSMFLLLQSLMLFLAPIVGDAAAYAISGLVCLLPVLFMIYGIYWMSRPAKKGNDQPAAQIPRKHLVHTVRRTVEEYPIESALVAAALGFSFNDKERLKTVLYYAVSHTDT